MLERKKLFETFNIWREEITPGVRNPVDTMLELCSLTFDGTSTDLLSFEKQVYWLVDQLQQAGEEIPNTFVAKCVLKALEGPYKNLEVFITSTFYSFKLEKVFLALKTFESGYNMRRKQGVSKVRAGKKRQKRAAASETYVMPKDCFEKADRGKQDGWEKKESVDGICLKLREATCGMSKQHIHTEIQSANKNGDTSCHSKSIITRNVDISAVQKSCLSRDSNSSSDTAVDSSGELEELELCEQSTKDGIVWSSLAIDIISALLGQSTHDEYIINNAKDDADGQGNHDDDESLESDSFWVEMLENELNSNLGKKNLGADSSKYYFITLLELVRFPYPPLLKFPVKDK